jgi:hypothetical protein
MSLSNLAGNIREISPITKIRLWPEIGPDQAWTSSIPLQHWRRRLNLSPAVDTGSWEEIEAGWWCNNHLETYEFVNGKDYPIYEMENRSHVPNHQPGGEGMTKYQDIPILQGVFRTGKAEKDVQQIQV